MSDLMDKILGRSSFGVSDEERKELLNNLSKAGFAGSFESNDGVNKNIRGLLHKMTGGTSSVMDEVREKMKALEGNHFDYSRPQRYEFNLPPTTFVRAEDSEISKISEQVIESFRAVGNSAVNLNAQITGMNIFMFHCLSILMGELITNPAKALEIKRTIEQRINQHLSEDSQIKTVAVDYCEKFFEKYSTGEDSADTITAIGEH